MVAGRTDKPCAFCSVVAGEVSAHEVLRDESVVAFLDHAPLFPGHVLVVPRTHHVTLGDLPEDQLRRYFSVVRRLSSALPVALDCTGTFVAANNVVSQSVPHLHFHVVPRTRGDGLRGFFWPRTRYREGEAVEVAARIRAVLEPV